MEKDYFEDRSKDYCKYNSVNIGDTVYVCEKHMQRKAKTINDLTKGIVIRKLTRHDHPRGIKLMIETVNKTTAVGRLVYIVKDNKVVTSNGLVDEKDMK